MTMQASYTWEYRLELSPYDKIIEVLEAFFASYPNGDYACEARERYKLRFRRGLWRKSLLGLGELVPDRLVKGQFNQWPVIVRVLVRPSPETFLVTVRYELHLPRKVPALVEDVQTSVEQHVRQELADLAAYLAECIGIDTPPDIAAV